MRYSDLIHFEPIESVIQLLDANRPAEAKKLVATYVISDDMAARIAKQMIPQLSFDEGPTGDFAEFETHGGLAHVGDETDQRLQRGSGGRQSRSRPGRPG